ncbi:MAG: pyrimidine/purine nucleoside phosphorylase [Bacteroidales bacterium]|nr:pyrimidine/purine nucleoside phosphorylase [Bacteroidales bacterium]HRX31325.1 pyrimidine/purine nucleoside phosphorylase [Tenuifilaceae bacterium]
MFKTNEYFDGNVKSIAFETAEGRATMGVMAKGEYEFGTSTVEYMTVVSGEMQVLLPGESKWKTYKEFETYIVPKDTKFKVKVNGDTAYRCFYR